MSTKTVITGQEYIWQAKPNQPRTHCIVSWISGGLVGYIRSPERHESNSFGGTCMVHEFKRKATATQWETVKEAKFDVKGEPIEPRLQPIVKPLPPVVKPIVKPAIIAPVISKPVQPVVKPNIAKLTITPVVKEVTWIEKIINWITNLFKM